MTAKKPVSVLLVGYDPDLLSRVKSALEEKPEFAVTISRSFSEGLASLEKTRFDAIVVVITVVERDCIAFLSQVRESAGKIPFLFFADSFSGELAIEALNLDTDFFIKSGEDPESQYLVLQDAIRKAIQKRSSANEMLEKYQAILSIQKELKESEEQFRTLIHTSRDIIAILNGTGNIRYINPAATAILGYSPERVIGKDPLLAVHPDDKARIRSALDSVYAKISESVPVTFRYLKGDGSVVILEAIGNNLLGIGGINGIVVTARDVTDRKKAEEAIRTANEKLNLLGNITRHDILNKMTVLLGYLELAKVAKDEATSRAFIAKIDDIAQVIEQQVEFTRDYQDLGVKHPEWQDVAEILDRALSQFDLGSIQVISKLAGLEIYADPLLEKVVYNLIDNSLRYAKTSDRITASYEEQADGLILTIEDNGIGIPAKDKQNIFKRGFGQHTGLGLFLVREILGITGLHIAETGFPGKGARFEIQVPPGNYRITRKS